MSLIMIFFTACSDISTLYSSGTVEGDYIRFDAETIEYGWYTAFRNGKQFVFPSIQDLDTVFEECLNDWGYMYLLKGGVIYRLL